MSTSDHLSLSSCTVIWLWDKYYTELSTVEPVALFFFPPVTNDGIDQTCSSISNPNFLLLRPFAHGTESCIKISAFLKSFAVGFLFVCLFVFCFVFVTEKWPVCQLRVCCITNIMTVYKHYVCVQTWCLCTNIMSVYKHDVCVQTLCLCTNIMSVYKHDVCVQTLCLYTNIMSVYKHDVCVQTWCLCTNIMSVYKRVNSRSHDIRFKNSVEEFPVLLHVSWNVMNPLGPLMSFTYNIFPIIQSVNMSTFPWHLMWLLFHNKVNKLDEC